MSEQKEEGFQGFSIPKKNYFHMPNEWTDISADINNLAELKVIEYLIRHTWGFKEYDGTPKAITTDEFMNGRKRSDGTRMDKGTGLSNKSVIDGLRRAIKDGYLTFLIDDSDKGRIIKSYALNMAELDVKNLNTRCEDVTHQAFKTFIPDVKEVHSSSEDSSYRSEKETIERNLEKETVEDTYVNADALTHTHAEQFTNASNEHENNSQQSTGTSQQDIHSEQASTDIPIATSTPQTDALIDVATRNTESLVRDVPPVADKVNSNGHTPRKFAPPVMPPDDVAWNAETLVQVLEARQGRRFPNGAQKKVNRVRDQALRDAEAIIDMGDIDRVAFVLAVNHLENRKNKWWLDNVGHVQPRHLLKNDKIHEMIDELKRQYGPSWREKLTQKNTATRKPSGPLATLPPPPKSNAELRMEAV